MKRLLTLLAILLTCVTSQEKQKPEQVGSNTPRQKQTEEYKKQRDEAVERAEQAVKATPYSASAHFELAEVYLQYFGPARTHDKRILAEYQNAIQLNPVYAEAYCGLASYFELQSDNGRQVEALNRAVSLKPDYAEAHCKLGFAYLNEKYQNGVKVPVSKQELKLAIDSFKRAAGIKPDLIAAYVGLGSASYSLELYTESLEAFSRAVLLSPTNIMGHLGLGSVHVEMGNREAAMQEYETLLQIAAEFEGQRTEGTILNPAKDWAEVLLKRIRERFRSK